jgi:hypothetical protein
VEIGSIKDYGKSLSPKRTGLPECLRYRPSRIELGNA